MAHPSRLPQQPSGGYSLQSDFSRHGANAAAPAEMHRMTPRYPSVARTPSGFHHEEGLDRYGTTETLVAHPFPGFPRRDSTQFVQSPHRSHIQPPSVPGWQAALQPPEANVAARPVYYAAQRQPQPSPPAYRAPQPHQGARAELRREWSVAEPTDGGFSREQLAELCRQQQREIAGLRDRLEVLEGTVQQGVMRAIATEQKFNHLIRSVADLLRVVTRLQQAGQQGPELGHAEAAYAVPTAQEQSGPSAAGTPLSPPGAASGAAAHDYGRVPDPAPQRPDSDTSAAGTQSFEQWLSLPPFVLPARGSASSPAHESRTYGAAHAPVESERRRRDNGDYLEPASKRRRTEAP